MFTVQGKVVAFDRFTTKKGDEFQTISLFTSLTAFGKVKPKLFDMFIPIKIEGVEMIMDKTVILPCSPVVKGGEVTIVFAEDGRQIQYDKGNGEFIPLKARPGTAGKPESGKQS